MAGAISAFAGTAILKNRAKLFMASWECFPSASSLRWRFPFCTIYPCALFEVFLDEIPVDVR